MPNPVFPTPRGSVSQRTIGSKASILLDTLRIAAATVVLVNHACDQWLEAYPALLNELRSLSHAAVVVFFVLSGYVIAFTTSNNRGPRQYAVARLSRLYPVLLPALLLTAAVEVIVTHTDAALAAHYTRGHSWFRYALSAGFLNESGPFSAAPPINIPLWSLPYEFWYYVIFGLWLYRSGSWKSWVLLAGACLVAGIKILVLMPIWLLGVLAYRRPRPAAFRRNPWLFVFGFLLVAGVAAVYLPPLPYEIGFKPFYMANRFLTDWIIGIFIALALWGLPSEDLTAPLTWTKPLRSIADLSFPLYILHHPLLVMWRALFGTRINDVGQMWQAMITVTIVSVLIGLFLESQRGAWVRFFTALLRARRPLAVSAGR